MRIISGKFKGKVFGTTGDLPVRPTTDFAKTGLFNLLDSRIDWEETKALDLFSGIGSIAFEMVSRGCKEVHSVDNHKKCILFQQTISGRWNMPEMRFHTDNVFSFLKKNPLLTFDLIFADPPYDLNEASGLPGMIFENAWLMPQGWLIVEHDGRFDWRKFPQYAFTRNYGRVHFSFFQNNQ